MHRHSALHYLWPTTVALLCGCSDEGGASLAPEQLPSGNETSESVDSAANQELAGAASGTTMASIVGPRRGVSCSSFPGAVVIHVPSDRNDTSLGERINAAPANKTICLRAGVHALDAPIALKHGQTLVGEYGATIDGSRQFVDRDWAHDANGWFAELPIPNVPDFEKCGTGVRCNEPNDVWFDGRLLRHAERLADLTNETAFFVPSNGTRVGRVYLRVDPRGHTVLGSRAFMRGMIVEARGAGVDSNDVTIRNLTIQHVGTPAQVGAIHSQSAWLVQENEIMWAHGACLNGPSGKGGEARRNSIHDCGQLGIKASGGNDPTLPSHDARATGPHYKYIENEVTRTNYAGYRVGWEAGASKFSRSDGILIRNNWFHENPQAGVWVDVNGINTTIEGNWITDNGQRDFWGTPTPGDANYGRGIFIEISCHSIIRGNAILGNGRDGTRGMRMNAGILISESHSVDVSSNLVVGNGQGIVLKEQTRDSTDGYSGAEEGTKGYCARWDRAGAQITDRARTPARDIFYQVHDVNIHGNAVAMLNPGQGATGGAHDYASSLYEPSRNIRFAENFYVVPAGTERSEWFSWGHPDGNPRANAPLSWADWQRTGRDRAGIFAGNTFAPQCQTATPDLLSPTRIAYTLPTRRTDRIAWARVFAPTAQSRRFWYSNAEGCASLRSASATGEWSWVRLGTIGAGAATPGGVVLSRAENDVRVGRVILVETSDRCGGDGVPTGAGQDCNSATALRGSTL